MGNISSSQDTTPHVVCKWQNDASNVAASIQTKLAESVKTNRGTGFAVVNTLQAIYERSALDLTIARIANDEVFHNTLLNHPSPTRVKQLRLKYKPQISALPFSVGYFCNLSTIDISRNGISTLPWSLIYLKNVTYLDVSHNKLVVVPRTIGNMKALQHFDLSHNPIDTLPTELLLLVNLTHINLSGCEKFQCGNLESIRTQLVKRQKRQNVWKSQRCCDDVNTTQTLLELCIETIMTSDVDYLNSEQVPPMVKTHLDKESQSQRSRVYVCKCSQCNSFFSSRDLFDVHTCVGCHKGTQVSPSGIADCVDDNRECADPEYSADAITDDLLHTCSELEKQTQTDPQVLDYILTTESTLPSEYYNRSTLNFNNILIRRQGNLEKMLSTHPNPSKVTQLCIVTKCITDVPECIDNFKHLTHLDLSNNCLKDLPGTIANLHNLTILDLHLNYFKHIPDVVGNLDKLKSLDVTNNNIHTIPTEVLSLPRLEKIEITQLDGFPDARRPLVLKQKSLEIMLLERFQREDVWKSLDCFIYSQPLNEQVVSLYVYSFNAVVSNDVNFKSCQNLPHELKIRLEKAAKSKTYKLQICKCSLCHGLFTSRGAFHDHVCLPCHEKPTPLWMIVKPAFYVTVTNRLKRFLSSSQNVVKTRKLLFDMKTKTADFTKANITDYTTIEHLLQSTNPNLSAATKLILKNNREIRSLPNSIGLLVNVTFIDISNNNLCDLPWSMIYIKELRELNISRNAFVSLANCIGGMTKLKTLNASYNPLTSLPTEILHLKNLVNLNLDGCSYMKSPNKDVCAEGLCAIRIYLEKRQHMRNIWDSTKPWYDSAANDVTQNGAKSLLELCIKTIANYGVVFMNVDKLPSHLRRRLHNECRAARCKVELFKCAECQKVFSNRGSFHTHICSG